MVYRIYISSSDAPTTQDYVQAVRTALFRMNEFPFSVQTANDTANGSLSRLDAAQRAMDDADFFIGVYGHRYGSIPPGQTESSIELEFRYARLRGLTRLLFMPAALRDAIKDPGAAKADPATTADDRLLDFARELAESHVINYFGDLEALQAQVVMSVSNYKQMRPMRRSLRPPSQRLRSASAPDTDSNEAPLPPGAPPAPPAPRSQTEAAETDTDNDAFEQMVDRALDLATDDIEQIVLRAMEVHHAQHVTAPQYDGWLNVNPIFGTPSDQSQFKADIFMIMPFRPQYDAVYQNVIVPTVADLNLTIKRGDEFSSLAGSIIQEVWAAIYACRLVIVETSQINANVYYELGMAHTLGKPALLITQETDIERWPFDIRHRRFIVYENTIPGGQKLEAALRKNIVWTLNSLEEAEAERQNGG